MTPASLADEFRTPDHLLLWETLVDAEIPPALVFQPVALPFGVDGHGVMWTAHAIASNRPKVLRFMAL
jgi:hypothetical protein